MRVITGVAKGRKLKAPKGMDTRPTSDRVKEALFSILGDRVCGTYFLDLFAGTGSIGIEALSRGAEAAVFVEQNPKVVQVIKENLVVTGLQDKGEVYCQEVQRALAILGRGKRYFDLVFVDPPYFQKVEGPTLGNLLKNNLLRSGSLVVVESSKRDQLPETVDTLKKFRTETYGDTALSFYHIT